MQAKGGSSELRSGWLRKVRGVRSIGSKVVDPRQSEATDPKQSQTRPVWDCQDGLPRNGQVPEGSTDAAVRPGSPRQVVSGVRDPFLHLKNPNTGVKVQPRSPT